MSRGTHLVLPVHVSEFSSADSNVACWHVPGWAQIPVQLGHERLAETADLALTLSLWVKVTSAFAATHRETRQGILEDLFKA